MGMFKWLYPGMRIKRWIMLCVAGVIVCSMGFVLTILNVQPAEGIALVVLGGAGVWVAIRKIVKSVVTVLLPQREHELVDIMFQKRHSTRGPRIVVIGGGSGLSVLLHGLKEFTSNITAVVTVADDGGSSGRLRSQFDIPAPGDIRSCLVALADAEPLMSDLFSFRFKESGELEGHSFGNLFILAMLKVTGDFDKAIKESSKILAIRGRVVPSTLKKVSLVAKHSDGSETAGETAISKARVPIRQLCLSPENCAASEDAVAAIADAEAIVLGPGSLYTSILPNLLIEELAAAIARANVPKIYICNVMTQPHETDRFTAFDHVNVLVEHTRPEIITHVMLNSAPIPAAILERYKSEEAFPVDNNTDKIRALGYEIIEDQIVTIKDMVRHNSRRISKLILDAVQNSKKKAR